MPLTRARPGRRCRACGSRLHLRNLHRRGDDLRYLVCPPSWSVAPDWPTGIALGLGGLAGGYTGARIQARLPDTFIRRTIGILVIAIGTLYLWSGLH